VVDRDDVQADQDGGVTGVVRGGEEDVRIGGDERVPVLDAGTPDEERVGRLPQPREQLVPDPEPRRSPGEALGGLRQDRQVVRTSSTVAIDSPCTQARSLWTPGSSRPEHRRRPEG